MSSTDVETDQQVPRSIERRVLAKAGPRDEIDVRSIEHEESNEDGEVYRIVVDDPDSEEGENPAFFALDPNDVQAGASDMFGTRVEAAFDRIRREVFGVEDAVDQELRETEAQLEESDHPGATGDDVEYGPGARANTEGLRDSYDDGLVRVESTTDADLPSGDTSEPRQDSTSGATPDEPTDQETTTMTRQDDHIRMETPDDFWGQIADAALDARELDQKGHDTAAEALLREIDGDIEDYLEDSD